jgi:hypothetical protein
MTHPEIDTDTDMDREKWITLIDRIRKTISIERLRIKI